MLSEYIRIVDNICKLYNDNPESTYHEIQVWAIILERNSISYSTYVIAASTYSD